MNNSIIKPIDNPTVLLLAAGSDIARALAYEYAKKGYNLQLAARNIELLEEIKSDLEIRYKISVNIYKYNALDIDNIESIENFYNSLNSIPSIVISAVGLDHDIDPELTQISAPNKIKLITSTNFIGPAIMLEYFASKLVNNPGKKAIVGISSVAGDRGRAKNYWYGAAKAGFSEFLSGLRQKYAKSNLLVMTVKPGFVYTKMTSDKNLPRFLTSEPDSVAKLIIKSINKNKLVVYPWKWRLIMLLIKLLPERIFYKLSF